MIRENNRNRPESVEFLAPPPGVALSPQDAALAERRLPSGKRSAPAGSTSSRYRRLEPKVVWLSCPGGARIFLPWERPGSTDRPKYLCSSKFGGTESDSVSPPRCFLQVACASQH